MRRSGIDCRERKTFFNFFFLCGLGNVGKFMGAAMRDKNTSERKKKKNMEVHY